MASMRWARALTPLTLGLLIFQALLVVTGGAVRLTGSGLGCPTWPECTPGSYRPTKNQAEGTLHSWIEFGNRLLTFVLVAFALATLITVFRAGRKDLRILAAGQFLGIFGQGILGGITVLTHLNPAVKTGIKGSVNSFSKTHIMWASIVIILGTLVTGAGPHAGDINAPRLKIRIQDAALFHGGAVTILLLFTIAFYFRKDISTLTKKRLAIFLGICLAQGGIGYIQYLQGVPELLVGMHLIGTTLVWIAAWRIWLSVQFKTKEVAQ